MARPESPAPRTTLRLLGLMAVLAALLGIVATGCGSEADDKATGDKGAQTDTDGEATDGEAGEDAADDAATGDEAGNGAAADEDAASDDPDDEEGEGDEGDDDA
ncbi:MAG: hypothetical protein JWM86_92 [Thermoleophilia bacterium]|nr:hypothetical protein [Thermoleophilia bacterium]